MALDGHLAGNSEGTTDTITRRVHPQICILNLCGFHRKCFDGGPRDMPEKGGVFACGPYVGPFCKCQGFGQVQTVRRRY